MPQVTSSILLRNKRKVNIELLIDTGSSLGLAIFSKDKCEFSRPTEQRPIGIGLNGIVRGYDLTIKQLSLGGMLIKKIRSHVVNIIEHPDEKFTYCGSIGAAFLKKHIVIFDYPSSKLFLLDQSTARTLRASAQIAALPS